MDAFGINWTYLLMQSGMCFSAFLLIALIFAFVKFNQPSKPLIILIGLITAWVILYQVGFFITMTSFFISDVKNGTTQGMDFSNRMYFGDSISPGMTTFYLYILLTIYYLFHTVKSPVHAKEQRNIYVLGFLIIPFITMPVYYFRYIFNTYKTL